MPAKISTHVFKGMQKDTNVANASNEYLLDAKNIRFTPSEDQTLFSITNEKGNTAVTTDNNIQGTLVGWYVVGEIIMMFTHQDTTDRIYRLTSSDNFDTVTVDLMYEGNLNLDSQHPLEFTSYYEAENVIKLYWVDGINQLRFMNILADEPYTESNDFNTTPELKLEENVTVEQIDGNGQFPAGVVQYAFTYVNKLGAESNIFYVTKLKSIQYKDRAAGPQEYVNCAFKITISNVDDSFDYIRCYQLIRTSLDAQPTCLILNEVPTNDTVTIIDTNVGSTYDATALLFQKYPIKPSTLDQKANTLFLGDINEEILALPDNIEEIQNYFKDKLVFTNEHIGYNLNTLTPYKHNADADIIRTFKAGETYRIAVQLQNKYGCWSQPIYIDDYTVDCSQLQDGDDVYTIQLKYTPDSDISVMSKYKKYRFLMVNPTANDRSVVSQGIVIPTIYEVSDRTFNVPFSYSSWFLRPFNSNIAHNHNQLIPYGEPDSNHYQPELQAGMKTSDIPDYSGLKWYTESAEGEDITPQDTLGPANIRFTITVDAGDAIEEEQTDFDFTITLKDCQIFKNNLNLEYIHITNRVLYNGNSTTDLDGTTLNAAAVDAVVSAITVAFSSQPVDSIYWKFLVSGNLDTGIKTGLTNWFSSQHDIQIVITSDNDEHSNTFLSATSVDLTDYIKKVSTNDVPYEGGQLSEFRVDHSILNLYSPDIDNNYYIINNNPNINLNLVGYTEVDSLLDNTYLELINTGSSPNCTVKRNGIFNIYHAGMNFKLTRDLFTDSLVHVKNKDGNRSVIRDRTFISRESAWAHFKHIDIDYMIWQINIAKGAANPQLFNFPIYSWHSTGSLNNEDNTEGENRSATYKKVFAKKWLCNVTNYYSSQYKCNEGISYVYNKTNNLITFLQDGQTRSYIGNPDIARTFVRLKNGLKTVENLEVGYDLYILDEDSENNIFKKLSSYYHTHYKESGDETVPGIFVPDATTTKERYPNTSYLPIVYGTDPIQIRYDSDTHVIIPINRTEENGVYKLYTLPSVNAEHTEPSLGTTYYPKWDNTQAYQDIVKSIYDLTSNSITKSYFHIGELTREVESRYGGTIQNPSSDEDPVLNSNIFIPIMEPHDIDNQTVYTNYGDTWYSRWDCLKTQEKTNQDEQSVHDYASVMIESHTNLNGRYDSYRNFYDQTLVNTQNANKFNDVYNQMDNFWSYKVTPNYTNTYYYPNQVTWSLTKNSGSLVDEWTRVTAANVQEFDGNEGQIRKILNYNDQLLVFQDRCISQILYNEQMQMTTTEGVPVEISNSQKVTGVRKLLDDVGCINKWSINASANGIAFIDNVNSSVMFWSLGSKESPAPVNLTNSKAFISFMKKYNLFDVWNPEDFSNFVTFNDKLNNEIYFVNDTLCLVFSLTMQEFTSFYSYEHTPAMFNIRDDFYSLYPVNNPKLWKNFKGEYNSFYDKETKDNSYITFIDKGESFLVDKTFTNINYVQDAYQVSNITDNDDFEDYEDKYYKYLPNRTFNQLKVWTPFQKVEKTLELVEEDMFNIQRKFRTWAIQIDKDSDDNRIRNNWAKFKLTFVPDTVDTKIELMNINVQSLE